MSTKPGVTSLPAASISSGAPPSIAPIAVMRSPSIARSARLPGCAGAVDECAVADDDVVRHGGSPLGQ